MSHNEEVDAVLNELRAFGIRGEVVPRSKHIEVSWVAPTTGRERCHISPATGSDRRGWLNARARVRRWMREDAVVPPSPEKRLLERALSLPTPQDDGKIRLETLEKDNETLVDWVVDLQQQLDAFKRLLSSVKVYVKFGEDVELAEPAIEARMPPPTQPVLSTPHHVPKVLKRDQVLLALASGAWVHRSSIAEETKMSATNLSSLLDNLKNEGLVENGLRGFWRRRPLACANGVQRSVDGDLPYASLRSD